jgi:hypothetical protein
MESRQLRYTGSATNCGARDALVFNPIHGYSEGIKTPSKCVEMGGEVNSLHPYNLYLLLKDLISRILKKNYVLL